MELGWELNPGESGDVTRASSFFLQLLTTIFFDLVYVCTPPESIKKSYWNCLAALSIAFFNYKHKQ